MDLSISSNIISSMGSINAALTAMGVSDLQNKKEEEEAEARKLSENPEFQKIEETRKMGTEAYHEAEAKQSGYGEGYEGPTPREELGAAKKLMLEASENTLREAYPKLYQRAQNDATAKQNLIRDLAKFSNYRRTGGTGSFGSYTRREQYKRDIAALKGKKLVPRLLGTAKAKLKEQLVFPERGEK